MAKKLAFDRVLFTIRRYFERQQLAQELVRSKQENKALSERNVGNTPQMQDVYKMIGKVAASDANVLIIGETGAGKESVAEMLHEYSSYSKGPLVKVNFAPDAKESDIRLLLVSVQGTLAGGPGQLGDYYVRVPAGKEALEEIRPVLESKNP